MVLCPTNTHIAINASQRRETPRLQIGVLDPALGLHVESVLPYAISPSRLIHLHVRVETVYWLRTVLMAGSWILNSKAIVCAACANGNICPGVVYTDEPSDQNRYHLQLSLSHTQTRQPPPARSFKSIFVYLLAAAACWIPPSLSLCSLHNISFSLVSISHSRPLLLKTKKTLLSRVECEQRQFGVGLSARV